MPTISLRYGNATLDLPYNDEQFAVIEDLNKNPPFSDVQINSRLDMPIGSLTLEDITADGGTVLFVVPDATRQVAAGQIVNLMVRRLIANGVAAFDIAVIFATGIHRKVTLEERDAILTPFITQRLKVLDHDPRDLARIVTVGETSCGIPVELNRALFEFDHKILIGGISFHYFAGFTGGRKLICPGLASKRTIGATHKLAFDCETMSRRGGVGTGLLQGNAVHEAFVEAASLARPSFLVNTMVDDQGRATDIHCGDWLASHKAACEAFEKKNSLRLPERRDVVIASCGGFPYDINLIQAHKTLDNASAACNDGGTIILLADCRDGLGNKNFMKWFTQGDSTRIASELCKRYEVNGQTAWSLMQKTERHKVYMVTGLDEMTVKQMGMTKLGSVELSRFIRSENRRGYILPRGAKAAIRV